MNSRSLLPPRGIFVPTQLIFHPQLPASVLVTWIQLRCLAWQGWETPPYNLAELASLTGMHPARLQRHLSHLQDIAALTWHSEKQGRFTITFPTEPFTRPGTTDEIYSAPNPITPHAIPAPSPTLASYFPTRIMGYLSYDEDEDEPFNPAEPARIENRPLKAGRQVDRQVPSLCASNY